VRLQRDGELLGVGKIGQVAQAEELQEHRGGAAEERPAERPAPPATRSASLWMSAAPPADTPRISDLRAAHGLPVGDHGERLERGYGQQASGLRTGRADGGGVDRARQDLVAAASSSNSTPCCSKS
jgi:hypothetical protein